MTSFLKKIALLAVVTGAASVNAATGKTTRYWDCCKSSCAWSGKAAVSQPINTCDANDNILASFDTQSGCNGGGAFTCTNQSPWAVSDDLALGFAAVKLAGGSEASWCCACYKLTFKSGPVAGKSMIVQATNTGGDLGENHFDIAMPGGGVGIFNGCTSQFGAPRQGWGAQYGGISSRSECDGFPEKLKPGCYWRYDWFKGADNPDVEFEQVTCPKQLTDRTGCIRNGEIPVNLPIGESGGTKPATTTTLKTLEKTSVTFSSTSTSIGQVKSTSVNSIVTSSSVPVVDKPSSTSMTKPTSTAAAASTTSQVSISPISTPINSSCPPPSEPTAKKYYQCGGKGYTGAIKCEAGSVCVAHNEWYSQCL